MRGKTAKILGGVVGFLLFLSALWVLYKTLKSYHLTDIAAELKSIPGQKLLLALGLTFLNYLVLTGYDTLAFKYIRNSLSYFKIAYASFIGYAFSLNMGYALISGGSARYRLYSSWHLPKTDIAKVIAFCTFTFWLGFFSLGGVIFLVSPPPLPPTWHLPLDSIQILGAGFLLLIGLYLFWGLLKRKTFKIRKWAFSPPQRSILIGQILLSALDWALAATVFYVLLPADSGVSYLTILSVLLLAQLASLASQVPAGLGVLESVVMLFLSPMIAASTLFGALLAYRAIYFLLPFCIAILMLLVHETRLRGRKTMKHLTPKEAFQKTKEGHVYLDVRTTEEFKKGHPKGAVNIPVFIAGPAGRELNPNFLAKVKEQFDKNAKLVVGCHSGGRSAKACEILISEGFAHVVNCKGSFGGGPDPETGEPVKGWKDEGLPVE